MRQPPSRMKMTKWAYGGASCEAPQGPVVGAHHLSQRGARSHDARRERYRYEEGHCVFSVALELFLGHLPFPHARSLALSAPEGLAFALCFGGNVAR